jgi:hypothetical protein
VREGGRKLSCRVRFKMQQSFNSKLKKNFDSPLPSLPKHEETMEKTFFKILPYWKKRKIKTVVINTLNKTKSLPN